MLGNYVNLSSSCEWNCGIIKVKQSLCLPGVLFDYRIYTFICWRIFLTLWIDVGMKWKMKLLTLKIGTKWNVNYFKFTSKPLKPHFNINLMSSLQSMWLNQHCTPQTVKTHHFSSPTRIMNTKLNAAICRTQNLMKSDRINHHRTTITHDLLSVRSHIIKNDLESCCGGKSWQKN